MLPTPEAIDASRRDADWLARGREVTHEPPAAQDPAAQAWTSAPPPLSAHTNPAHVVRWIKSQKQVDQRVQGLGIALVVAGCLVIAVSGYFALLKPLLVEPVNTFEAPGGVTERLDGGEERIIFIQTDGTRHGHVDPRGFTGEGLGCTVRETSGGTVARPRRAGEYTLTKNQDVYEAKLEFRAPRSGRYRFECTPTAEHPGPLPMAVGPPFDFWRSGIIFFAGFVGSGVLILAGVLVVLRARNQPARDAA